MAIINYLILHNIDIIAITLPFIKKTDSEHVRRYIPQKINAIRHHHSMINVKFVTSVNEKYQ